MIENTLSTSKGKGRDSPGLSPNQFLLDTFIWSFSRVNAYAECPRMFKLQYIDGDAKEQNAFAEWGSLCHSILERFYKGEKQLYELADAYEQEYHEAVPHSFPENKYKDLNDSYYHAGLDYFCSFNGLEPCYEVLAVEQEVNLTFEGFKFIGYIDLVLRDRNDKKIVIVDHKSKSGFKNDEEKNHYLLQLYLYAQYVFETYGEYPKELVFNMFRAQRTVVEPFNKDAFQLANQWFTSVIRTIYQDQKFKDKISIEYAKKKKKLSDYNQSDYFCNNLCSVRKHCNRSKCHRGDRHDD